MENEMKTKSASGIASLVLGIISTISALFWYVTVPTGILAIVFGVKGIKSVGSKVGKAGMILGIVGLSLFILIYIGIILSLYFSEIRYY